MNKAEVWLKETMTVRRWLAVLCVVAVLATVAAYGAVSFLRPEEAGGDEAVPTALGGAGEQRPTSLCITDNVGSIGILDGRANVTLDVYPTRLPIAWTVTVRTIPGTGTTATAATVRELELKDADTRLFAAALDGVVRNPDPDNDVTVGGTTIHAVSVGPTEYHYDLKCVGTLRLDADGMADLKRMLDKAEAQRAWLLPRTVPLRVSAGPPPTVAEVRAHLHGEIAHCIQLDPSRF